MEGIGRLFKRIHTLMERNFNATLAQYDLTTAQLDILVTLFRNDGQPLCQKDIERRLALRNPTVTGTLQRLEAKGFVTRSQSDTDRRYNMIALTDRARQLDKDLMRSRVDYNARMLQGFTPREQEEFVAYLDRVIDNLKE